MSHALFFKSVWGWSQTAEAGRDRLSFRAPRDRCVQVWHQEEHKAQETPWGESPHRLCQPDTQRAEDPGLLLLWQLSISFFMWCSMLSYLKWLHPQIMHAFSVAPFDQNLSIDGRCLTDDSATLGSLGVIPESIICLKVKLSSIFDGSWCVGCVFERSLFWSPRLQCIYLKYYSWIFSIIVCHMMILQKSFWYADFLLLMLKTVVLLNILVETDHFCKISL